MIQHESLDEALGTMVINDDDDDQDTGTMQRYDTGPTPQDSGNNSGGSRPSFMEYFDNPAQQANNNTQSRSSSSNNSTSQKREGLPPEEAWKFSKNITEMDFDFLRKLTLGDLHDRLNALDPLMEKEIEDLRKRYHEKRQPILDAIDAKKRRQQNF